MVKVLNLKIQMRQEHVDVVKAFHYKINILGEYVYDKKIIIMLSTVDSYSCKPIFSKKNEYFGL